MQKNQKQIFLFSESNDQISRCNGVRSVRIYTKMRKQMNIMVIVILIAKVEQKYMLTQQCI